MTAPMPERGEPSPNGPDSLPIGEGLDEKDHALVLALLQSRTIADGAAAAGMSARTAHRRLARPEVHAALVEARRAVLAQAGTQLVASASKATQALVDILDETEAPAAARASAARTILEMARGVVFDLDLVDRIAALEREREA
jgi:hypothetical protein